MKQNDDGHKREARSRGFLRFLSLALFVGLVLPVAGSVVSRVLAPEWRWDNAPFHAAIEVAGGLIALGLGAILLTPQKQESSTSHHFWMAVALIGMGILDIAHGAIAPGETFVWFHSMATCVGGVLFALVWLPGRIADSPRIRQAFPLLIVAVLTICAYSLGLPHMVPTMVEHGGFTTTAKYLNMAGGLGFLSAAGWLLNRYRVTRRHDDFLFACLCTLFGAAGVLSEYFLLWDAVWWWWHLLRLLAYCLAIRYFIIAYRQQAASLATSEAKFHMLYEATTDAVMLLDEKGFFDCNEATVRLFDCSDKADFCSRHPGELSPARQPCGTDSMALASERIATATKSGSCRFEWMHKRYGSGEAFPAEVLLDAMELDGKHVLQAVVRDITDRKRAEEELRQKMEQLERFNRQAVGREERMIELKREVNEMARKAGIVPPYQSFLVEAAEGGLANA